MKITNNKYKYEILEKEKVIICKDSFNAKYLCLYPNEWKSERIILIPAFVLSKEAIYKSDNRNKFDEFVKFECPGYEKVYLISGVKNEIYIHPEGMHKIHINIEDLVNDVHIIKESELKEFLLYKDKYKEKNYYEI